MTARESTCAAADSTGPGNGRDARAPESHPSGLTAQGDAGRTAASRDSTVADIPHFLIIGTQKGGTSSLFNYLCTHPRVTPADRKEVHYFDLHFGRGPEWYRSNFAAHAARRARETVADSSEPLLTGEASPYYLFHPLTAARAAATCPWVRIIVLLRNPVDRAYSHYHMEVRYGIETLSFEDAIDVEAQRLQGEHDRLRSATTDDAGPGHNHQHYSYLARGMYADQLATWLAVFLSNQVLVLRSEDFFNDPAQVTNDVAVFLGLSHFEVASMRRWGEGQYPPMAGRTRQRLLDYFAPHNDRLRDLLGRDFAWTS